MRAVEAKLKDLEPRAANVEAKIDDIEAAHPAAEQLPTDLEELTSQRQLLNETVAEADRLAKEI